MTDAGVPLILCTIREAQDAGQWDRARLLCEGLAARLADDQQAMVDWLRQLRLKYQGYDGPEFSWRGMVAAVDMALARMVFGRPVHPPGETCELCRSEDDA